MKIVLLVLLGSLAVCCQAQCDGGAAPMTWSDQPYDTDPNSLNDPNGTPVGFLSLTYPGTDNMEDPKPCIGISLPDGSIRYLIVLVETGNENVCVGVEGDPTPTCGENTFPLCYTDITAGVGNVNIEFSCSSSCAQDDISIYYRVITEAVASNIEDYCDNINATYPSSLRVIPMTTVNVDIETRPTAGASILSSLAIAALLSVSLLATLMV